MQKPSSLLLFTIITLGVLFFIYHAVTKLKRPSPSLPSAQVTDSNRVESQFDTQSGYVFSHPSNGSLAKTQNISITHNQDGTATGVIENSTFTPKVGQEVLLYSVKNNVIPLAGKISNIEQGDTHTTVTISIPKEIKDILNINKLSNNAEIIIFLSISSQRYPYSALQKDKNGNHFVWTIEKSEDHKKIENEVRGTHKINKTWIDKPTLGLKYFVAGRPINAFSLVVLNPDDKLKDGKNYKASKIKFRAPIYAGHKQALRDYRKKLIELKKKKHQDKIDKCRSGKSRDNAIHGGTSASCNSKNTKEKTADEIIQFLLSH